MKNSTKKQNLENKRKKFLSKLSKVPSASALLSSAEIKRIAKSIAALIKSQKEN